MFVLYVLKFFYVIQMDEASTQEIRKTIFSNCGKFFFFLFFWENENLRWNISRLDFLQRLSCTDFNEKKNSEEKFYSNTKQSR